MLLLLTVETFLFKRGWFCIFDNNVFNLFILFEASTNEKKRIIQFISDNEVKVENTLLNLDEVEVSENKRHVLIDSKSYAIELVSVNYEKKWVELKINNKPYQVKVKNQFDLLLNQLGMTDMATKKIIDLKAPMPGLVVDILVEVGQEVKEGDNLLILEAMKMENALKSPITGIIKSIAVEPKNTVEKNQLLVLFE